MAALRAAVFPLFAKNRRGGHFCPPSSARVKRDLLRKIFNMHFNSAESFLQPPRASISDHFGSGDARGETFPTSAVRSAGDPVPRG